jgi:hypothetical protein
MGELARGTDPAAPESAVVPGEPGTGNRHLGWLAAGIAVASIAMAVAADILGVARGSSVKGVAGVLLKHGVPLWM